MAAAGLIVTVTHSNEKHDLHITPQQGCSEPTVRDLAQVVEEATGVPLPFQKLIFKGKSLKEMEKPLSAFGVQNGCRVMLIGKKNSPEEEVELKKLKDLEKSVEKIADQLEELNKELTGIQQGFLAKDLQTEALCKLDKRVKATIEQFMKILEEIDTLEAVVDAGVCYLDSIAGLRHSLPQLPRVLTTHSKSPPRNYSQRMELLCPMLHLLPKNSPHPMTG